MIRSFLDELWQSSDAIFQNHLSWLLITGPIAILGQNVLSEATCFTLAGIALIPCAERLSFVTEQVALHTNASIGALLNATFGNAPELLIATAAIRSGFYRLTQLTMLGSMITNMVFVFGLSCFVGGLRWQTQELHASTAVIAMLLLSTAGSLIPAALVLSGHFVDSGGRSTSTTPTDQDRVLENILTRNTSLTITPSQEEITLSRVNAAVMLIAYMLYLIFQLGTHVNEVSPERQSKRDNPPRPNIACRRLFKWAIMPLVRGVKKRSSNTHLEFSSSSTVLHHNASSKSSSRRHPDVNGSSHHSLSEMDDSDDEHDEHDDDDEDDDAEAVILLKKQPSTRMRDDSERSHISGQSGADPLRIRETGGGAKHVLVVGGGGSSDHSVADPLRIITPPARRPLTTRKSKDSDHHHDDDDHHHQSEPPRLTMRVGIFWLFVVTMCISAMSDILVDTIDGFAQRMRLSQVFTSMVIIPFFSNIAEQVSSVIFGYRNEMDLCVGVTIGSAIQIATFVLPGSVLMAMLMDRSMTLYFHSYETVCWFFCTVLVSFILLSKQSNWLVGAILILTYVMFAAGIWYHEIENLSVDAEDYDHSGIGGGN